MNLTVMLDGSERIHYRDPSIPIYVSRGDLKTFPDKAALCHWHEDVELLLPFKGYLSYSVNGRQVHIPQGSAIFVNARQMHYGYSADGSDCNYICVTFRPQLLCANEEIKKRYVLPIVSNPHFTHAVLDPSIAQHQAVLSALRQLDALNRQNPCSFELQEMACIFSIWQALYQISIDRLDDAAHSDANVSIQKQMLEFIRIHYHERITLRDIAASGGVCRTKCCQLFKKYLSRIPNDYLNSFRLEKGILSTAANWPTDAGITRRFPARATNTASSNRRISCSTTVSMRLSFLNPIGSWRSRSGKAPTPVRSRRTASIMSMSSPAC